MDRIRANFDPAGRHDARPLLMVVGAAFLLTVIFWDPLWQGGGLIGGDLYTYYFPQKTFYAACLQQGELPFWNNLAGNGYPLVAESQTGAFYPFHLLFYTLLGVNAAYNTVQIAHYALAFLFTWMYARRLGLASLGAGLAALVFTYGWFPVRMCLEWAIVSGAWFPLALWGAEAFLQTSHWRYLFVLSAALAMQMLPGHYNLGFITQLTLSVYVPLRLWGPFRIRQAAETAAAGATPSPPRVLAAVALAGVCGFGLSAVQLLPSWELRQMSQRASAGKDFDPGYGNIPPAYLPQIVAPWWYYGPEPNLYSSPGLSATNKVEAHLYFGLLPFLLFAGGLWKRWFLRDRRLLLWLALGLLALLYTPGWLLPVMKHLPGFGFFSGPGRYGMVTTLAAGLLAGAAFDRLLEHLSGWTRPLCVAGVVLATTADLWIVNNIVSFNQTILVSEPPLAQLKHSRVRDRLAAFPAPVRLFSRGANLPTILGFASTPAYLGIGPAAYFDPSTRMPEPLPFDEPASPAQIGWLRRAGVTHILSFIPLDASTWPVTPVWVGYDPFLNRSWARREPLYLYRLEGSRGRIAWVQPQSGDSAAITEYRANRVAAEATSSQGGRLVLTDLDYPGWQVAVDGQPAAGIVVDAMYRGVELPPGRHTVVWTFAPRSITIGGSVSLITFLVLAAVAHVRFWHPAWFQRAA